MKTRNEIFISILIFGFVSSKSQFSLVIFPLVTSPWGVVNAFHSFPLASWTCLNAARQTQRIISMQKISLDDADKTFICNKIHFPNWAEAFFLRSIAVGIIICFVDNLCTSHWGCFCFKAGKRLSHSTHSSGKSRQKAFRHRKKSSVSRNC